MNIEQVKAWYEGAELVTKESWTDLTQRRPDLSTIKWYCGAFKCYVLNADFYYVPLWSEKEGFPVKITKYRELKVGDVIELNGLKGEVRGTEGGYFMSNLDNTWNYLLLGTDSVQEANAISKRIVGHKYQDLPTLQDLSKLYWVRKYELKYGEPREDSANTTENKTANSMSEKRELIGYNWKEEKYAKMYVEMCRIDGIDASFSRVTEFTNGGISQIALNELIAPKLKQEGLLDLWTVPVYREKEKVFTMGFGEDTFKVVVKDGKAYHNDDDITKFVEGLNEIFNTPTTVGGFSYVLEDKNVIFTSTGCQNKKSSLEQWDEVHDALG